MRTIPLGLTLSVPPGELTFGAPAEFRALVSNTGVEPLYNVSVVSEGTIIVGVFGTPTIVVGNGDAVLDAGEQWSYTATGAEWTSTTGEARATAAFAGGEVISTVAAVNFAPVHPISIGPIAGPTALRAAETGTWTFTTPNQSSFPV